MIEFRILGALEAREDGRPVPLGGTKQRALLAVLLLNANQTVSAERLLDELWGAETPATAAKAIQVHVSRLRKALPGTRLHTRPAGYLLELEPDQLDLHRFERLVSDGRQRLADGQVAEASANLREALGLWRGPPLAEFATAPFAGKERVRLDELRMAALEERIEADLAVGRHVALVAEIQALVAEHPFRERLRGQLMIALYRSDRQAEALEVYHATRRALVDELGIDPSPALQQLERRILTQDMTLQWKHADTADVRSGRPETARVQRSILLVPRNETGVAAIAALAEPLATSHEPHGLILARVVAAANGAGVLSAVAADLDADRRRLVARGVPVRVAAFTSSEPVNDLVRLASEQDVDLMLIDTPQDALLGARLAPDLGAVLIESPCDVAMLVIRERDERTDGRSVLVPFGGVEHDWAALELGAWIASAQDLPLRLLGVEGDRSTGQRDASRLLASASLAVQQLVGVAPEPVLLAPGVSGLLGAAEDAGLLVVGLPPKWRGEGLGEVRSTIVRRAAVRTLVVHRGPRPGGLAPRASLTHFTWSLSGAAESEAG